MTGLEDDPSGALRVYVGPRYKGIYALVEDPADQEQIRQAWGSSTHLLVPKPNADQLFKDDTVKQPLDER